MSPFLEYLCALAPEGETLLLVEQKATNKTYNDGSPKYVWPAMLPTKWKPNRAIYANTASFILDRMTDGKLSASAANCEYVLFLVCDDIGTKSKKPPLPPTWRIETSPGNEQWGYAFSEQPRKGEYAAAIEAIAAAGYTDPGAINPVRNVRIPGSINLKPGKDNFEAVLVEFDRTREYTLAEICSAFGVVPAEASTASVVPIKLADDGKDDVMAWLNEQGAILEPANGAGWVGVTCPNHAEHTDGQIGGRYHPVTRSYCCLHSHCQDWTSTRFLDWIAEQGGPDHEPGVRDDLLAATMQPMLEKLAQQPRELFSEAGDAIEQIKMAEAMEQARQRARLHRDQWFERFIYVQNGGFYFDTVTKQELTAPVFDSVYAHVPCTEVVNNKVRPCRPSRWYDVNREPRGVPAAVDQIYAAGGASLLYREGEVFTNRWRDGRVVGGGAGSPEAWIKHCERVIPDKSDREHVWNVMAFKLQNPQQKINHAILLGGNQGCGKDTVFKPFLRAIGGKTMRNVEVIDHHALTSQFNYYCESEVVVVNELRPEDFKDRRQVENILKPVIAAPPEFLTVNRKGKHPHKVINRTLVIAMSNHNDAIALTSDDRRWFIIWSPAKLMGYEEGLAMQNWLERGGNAAVAEWLMQRDVSAFNPGAKPPETAAKRAMIEDARSPAEAYIIAKILAREGPFARGVVAGPMFQIIDQLQATAPAAMKLGQSQLMHALQECGWYDLGQVHCKEYPNKRRMFCVEGMLDQLSRSEMRRMVEEPLNASMVRVK